MSLYRVCFLVVKGFLALEMGETVAGPLCTVDTLKHKLWSTSASPQTLTCCPCCSQLRTHWLSSSKPWVQLYMPSKTGGGGLQTTGTQCPSSHCPLSRHWTFRNFLGKHRHQTGLQNPIHCTLAAPGIQRCQEQTEDISPGAQSHPPCVGLCHTIQSLTVGTSSQGTPNA